MNYILKLSDNSKSKALLQLLKSLDFVEIEKHDADKEFRGIIKAAEASKSLSFKKAKQLSENWKSRVK